MAISKVTRNRIEELLRCEEHNDIFNLTTEARRAFQYEVLNALEDADPVKHGRWVFNQYDANPKIGNWHCSVCRGISIERGSHFLNYCPNCGADMRGGKGE